MILLRINADYDPDSYFLAIDADLPEDEARIKIKELKNLCKSIIK